MLMGLPFYVVGVNGAVLQDLVGNAAVLTLPGLSGVARIDGVAPSALVVEGPEGTVNPGEDATFVITWTEPVTVTGSPYLTITIGANERRLSMSPGAPAKPWSSPTPCRGQIPVLSASLR